MNSQHSGLPLYPGYQISKPKDNHHLPHNWSFINGTPIPIERNISTQSIYSTTSTALPDWIVNDRKILCFKAYFREDLQETHTATYQIRIVKILFYLEDGTIQVIEPRIVNSGIAQGSIVSRQHVPRTIHNPSDLLGLLDLNVQKEITIFDQVYKITDCDQYTRHYLTRAGIIVPESIATPPDPTQAIRTRMEEALKTVKPRMPHEDADKMEKFLKYDQKCLKFYAYWDDRCSVSGEFHDLIVYYYLSDDTFQICEVNQHKSTLLFRRLKLPKKMDGTFTAGQKSNVTILNTLGTMFKKPTFIQDRLDIGKPDIEYYTDKDLRIGAIIDFLGRRVTLTDCDEFTKQYYRESYGIEEFEPIEKPRERFAPSVPIDRTLPPYNGWGSIEDSEANCMSIQPKPKCRDVKQFMALDPYAFKFRARMLSDIADNFKREFIITFHLGDNSISVYEVAERNSGFTKGEFFKRSKFCLPYQEQQPNLRPESYRPQHFYIGAIIQLNSFEFQLTDANEFTFNYMESYPFDYPLSDIKAIMRKIKAAIQPIYKEFICKYLGNSFQSVPLDTMQHIYICYDTTRNALIDLLNDRITEHEIITFARHFRAIKNNTTLTNNNRHKIQALVQLDLERDLWDDLKQLKELLYEMDSLNLSGYMASNRLYSIVVGCRLPIKSVSIDDMFSVLNKDTAGNIEVNDFLQFIDRVNYRVTPIEPTNIHVEQSNGFNSVRQQLIDWTCLIEELDLEKQLREASE